jgi:prepilin-type N-terminal cleavage/methylation domain-containing protein
MLRFAGKKSSLHHAVITGSPRRLPRRRRGFTFTEILFAVLILGIGFILIAAIFPVAIRQTQATGEETAGATIAKGGVAYLEKYSSQSSWYPGQLTGLATTADGFVHLIGPNSAAANSATATTTNMQLWPQICGNLILPTDPRYAWVAMYRQPLSTNPAAPGGLPYIQLIVIGVQARNRQLYDSNDLAMRADGLATLQARPLLATFTGGTTQTVALSANDPTTDYTKCVSEGSYIVVANDASGQTTNGWIYRLGTAVGPSAPNTWNLAPGNDITPNSPVPGGNSLVFMVGSGYVDANPATTGYSGPCQDVAVYTTFMTVH